MFPFYLYAEQSVHISVVQDNAKTHKKKSSVQDRRQLFARSRSEPFMSSRKGSLTRGGRSSRSIKQRPRPQLNRWNSFSNRSSTPVLQEEGESGFCEQAKSTKSLMANAPKPVRRGSWGSSDFMTSPKKKQVTDICGSPMATRGLMCLNLE